MILYAFLFSAFCYISTCAGLYLFQEKVIFFPEPLPNDFFFRFNHAFEENYIKVEANIKLHSLLFRADNSKGCVLYHHGNSRNLCDWSSNYVDFTSRGYDVLFYDYRGFGKSDGTIQSEKQLIDDALAVHSWLSKRYPSTKIIQFGRSLGSGIAAQISASNKAELLVLETPYYSLLSMAQKSYRYLPISLLLKYKFKTNEILPSLKGQVILLHGTNDKRIKKSNSEKLNLIKPDSQLYIVKGGSHNNLPMFPSYQRVLTSILK